MAVAGGVDVTMPGEGACADDSCSPAKDRPWQGSRVEASEASLAAVALLRSLGPILLIGVGIGLAIELLVPPEVVEWLTGQ